MFFTFLLIGLFYPLNSTQSGRFRRTDACLLISLILLIERLTHCFCWQNILLNSTNFQNILSRSYFLYCIFDQKFHDCLQDFVSPYPWCFWFVITSKVSDFYSFIDLVLCECSFGCSSRRPNQSRRRHHRKPGPIPSFLSNWISH